MSITIDLHGRVALVTGGARGIGLSIGERLMEAGATVITCGRSESVDIATEYVRCDVRDHAQVEALVERIVAVHGRLDIAVNNAGGSPHVDAATASPRFSEAIVRLNLLAPLDVAQAANRVMQRQVSGGVIVNIGSMSALRPSPGAAAYGAAKAGLLSLTRSLAAEWAPKVRVNMVSAGMIATADTLDHYGGAAGVARVGATVPLGRMATPSDIADACVFLASDRASYVTGTHLEVHGGGERPAYLAAAAEGGAGQPAIDEQALGY